MKPILKHSQTDGEMSSDSINIRNLRYVGTGFQPVLVAVLTRRQTEMSVVLVWITPEDYTLRQVRCNNSMSDKLQ